MTRALNRLGMAAWNVRDAFRNAVPQSVRAAVRDRSPVGAIYKAAKGRAFTSPITSKDISGYFGAQPAYAADSVGQSTIWQTGGWPDQATYDNWVANGGDSMLTYEQAQAQVAAQMTQQQTTTSGGSGGGTATQEPAPFQAYFGGQLYTDPIAYTNAVTEAATNEFNRQNKLLTDAYQSGLLDFATYQDQLVQARETIKGQYSDAMGSISGRFSAMSPDAYQSSQGKSEGRAKDITEQNYANVAGQEANLNLQRSQYDTDYANKLESNRLASQQQIDETVNQTLGSLADTPYANKVGGISAPQLNTMTPMDSSVLGVYDNLSQLSKSGNVPAIKSTIANINTEPNIKDWLYTRFLPKEV